MRAIARCSQPSVSSPGKPIASWILGAATKGLLCAIEPSVTSGITG